MTLRSRLLLLLGWLPATLLAAGSASAAPLLSEVFYDAVGADDGQLFVEIAGAPGSLLDGLVVEGVNGADGSVTVSIALTGPIPASGLFVLADRTAAGTSTVAGANQLADFDFQNGPDSVVLRSGASVLDALGYGAFGAGEVFAGEGQPAPDAAAGASLARRFADLDTGDNAADFVELAVPTPGTASFLPVPEPGGVALAGVLAAAARRRSRRTRGGARR